MVTSPARLDCGTHLTLVGAGAGAGEKTRLGRLQYPPAHSRVRIEGRLCEPGTLPLLACMRYRTGNKPGRRSWETPLLFQGSCRAQEPELG